MRILMVSWEYPPVIEGGLGRHVRKLSEALVADGHEVHVLTRAVGPAGHERLEGVNVHRVAAPPVPRELDPFLEWVGQMNDDLVSAGLEVQRGGGFDLVHTHDWLVASAGTALRDELSLPWLVTVHATEHGRHQGWVQNHPQSYIHAAERDMVHRADAVIACSEYMAQHITEVFEVPGERVTAIHNGIDPSDVRPPASFRRGRARARWAEADQPLVALVGRLVYEKGFHVALDALAQLSTEMPDVRFVVAGTGTAAADLEAQAREIGIAERGRFLGWIDDDTLHAVYRVSDVCVVPSIYEPFGIVALEAMAAGCVPVVSDVGGLREIVPESGECGLRVPVGDGGALAAALRSVLSDAERRAGMVRAARHLIKSFDWPSVARATEGIYTSLVPHPAA